MEENAGNGGEDCVGTIYFHYNRWDFSNLLQIK